MQLFLWTFHAKIYEILDRTWSKFNGNTGMWIIYTDSIFISKIYNYT
jgi:hypothetical protein